MTSTEMLEFFFGWLVLASLGTFALFGLDKWRAKDDRTRRIREASLLFFSVIGGWPGGLLAILVFRHKLAKPSFLLQFFAAFIGFAFLCVGVGRLSGKI